ncbi:hypothetical protein C474_04640 [Halogeometricum pallidum JCM 14848]|uniref:Uncharacterized protein n=1 Tax=Halogeometricum pallidum JCM 14848 TaxID=1227487 RepID=M0DEV1_HALPD|nr:hypothetical protein [Halogeometricum pallidum]ELZ33338.1 hypothetical protein C474_04640 [Halogeometricum pallidum JCM 14848]
MSTNTRPTTESQTTTSQSTPADAPSADAAPETTDDAESWVARCQRQFDSTRTDRLRNLADAENEAMP